MSDPSGFSSLPPTVPPPAQPAPAPITPEQILRAIEIPPELQTQITQAQVPIQLEAQIQQVSTAAIILQTPQGEITAQPLTTQTPPPAGTAVQLEIPPTPAQTAIDITLRPLAQPTIEQRGTATPVEISPAPAARSATITPPIGTATETIPPFPAPGSLIRLEPFPQAIAQNTLQTTPPVIEFFQAQLPEQPAPIQIPNLQTSAPVITPEILQPPPNFRLPALLIPNTTETPLQQFLAPPTVQTPTSAQPITIPTPAPTQLQAFNTPPEITITPATAPLDVRVTNIVPPAPQITAPETTPALNPPQAVQAPNFPAIIPGIIQGQTPEQLPILSLFTPAENGQITQQNFTLQFPTESVTPGTQLQLTPLAAPPASQLLAPLFTPAPWPIFEELQQTLTQAAPAAAQALNAVTPNPATPAQLGPAALFFIAAIRGGDIQSWLGEKATEILRRDGARSNLLTRLSQEIGQLTRAGADPIAQDWRALSIPLAWQNDIHKIVLHYKHDNHDSDPEAGDGAKGTRFVFDLTLDAMGKVQLDALFRPVSTDGPRLDVILRTEQNFSQAMQAEMRRLYAGALVQSFVTGELSFHGTPEGWVTITPEAEATLGVDA